MMQEGVVSVCLCDTSGRDDLHINDLLVEEGYAEFAPDDWREEELNSHVSLSAIFFCFASPRYPETNHTFKSIPTCGHFQCRRPMFTQQIYVNVTISDAIGLLSHVSIVTLTCIAPYLK